MTALFSDYYTPLCGLYEGQGYFVDLMTLIFRHVLVLVIYRDNVCKGNPFPWCKHEETKWIKMDVVQLKGFVSPTEDYERSRNFNES